MRQTIRLPLRLWCSYKHRLCKGLGIELKRAVEDMVQDIKEIWYIFARNILWVPLCDQDCSVLSHGYQIRSFHTRNIPIQDVQRQKCAVWCYQNTCGRVSTYVEFGGDLVFRTRQCPRMKPREWSRRDESKPSSRCGQGYAQDHTNIFEYLHLLIEHQDVYEKDADEPWKWAPLKEYLHTESGLPLRYRNLDPEISGPLQFNLPAG